MLMRCISSASFVPLPTLTLNARCNRVLTPKAGRAHGAGIFQIPGATMNVELVQDILPPLAELEDARTDSGGIQLLCDVVAQKPGRACKQDSVHPRGLPPDARTGP